jgi:hypothetical protein
MSELPGEQDGAGGSNPAQRHYNKMKGDLHMPQNLERNHAMTFRVTEKERDMIHRRQEQTGIKNMRAYLLKMAIDGRVIHIELDSVNEMCRLLGNISNNINQIARRANETNNIHLPDIEDIQAKQDEIWKQQKEILRRLGNTMDSLHTKTK